MGSELESPDVISPPENSSIPGVSAGGKLMSQVGGSAKVDTSGAVARGNVSGVVGANLAGSGGSKWSEFGASGNVGASTAGNLGVGLVDGNVTGKLGGKTQGKVDIGPVSASGEAQGSVAGKIQSSTSIFNNIFGFKDDSESFTTINSF